MTRIIALVALVVLGGIVGAFAYSQLSGEASAAPGCPPKCPTPTPAPQQREDQIALTPWVISLGTPNSDWAQNPDTGTVNRVLLNAADYPSSATFAFEAVLHETVWNMETCARLFDLTASLPVSGSEACLTSAGNDAQRVRSQPFALPSTDHEYTLEGRIDCAAAQPPSSCGSSNGAIVSSRIIAEWTE